MPRGRLLVQPTAVEAGAGEVATYDATAREVTVAMTLRGYDARMSGKRRTTGASPAKGRSVVADQRRHWRNARSVRRPDPTTEAR